MQQIFKFFLVLVIKNYFSDLWFNVGWMFYDRDNYEHTLTQMVMKLSYELGQSDCCTLGKKESKLKIEMFAKF